MLVAPKKVAIAIFRALSSVSFLIASIAIKKNIMNKAVSSASISSSHRVTGLNNEHIALANVTPSVATMSDSTFLVFFFCSKQKKYATTYSTNNVPYTTFHVIEGVSIASPNVRILPQKPITMYVNTS
jgi:hypothetical protein